MKLKHIVGLLLLAKNAYCNNGLDVDAEKGRISLTQTRNARFNILNGDFDEQRSPENYFPEIEYPSDILQMVRPFYFKATSDDVLDPFPREVKEAFKAAAGGEEVDDDSGEAISKPVLRNKKEFLNDINRQAQDIVDRINFAMSEHRDEEMMR